MDQPIRDEDNLARHCPFEKKFDVKQIYQQTTLAIKSENGKNPRLPLKSNGFVSLIFNIVSIVI